MKRMEHIRTDFREKFITLAHGEDVGLLSEGYSAPFPEDNIIANWISEDLKKIMRLQEADEDETLQFDAFTAKAGENYEYDDLCIEAVSVNEKAALIYDIYKLWFVENISPAQMNNVLEGYENLYQPNNSFRRAA